MVLSFFHSFSGGGIKFLFPTEGECNFPHMFRSSAPMGSLSDHQNRGRWRFSAPTANGIRIFARCGLTQEQRTAKKGRSCMLGSSQIWCRYDVLKFCGFFDPHRPCLHLDLFCTIKFTQPLLLRPLFHDSPSPLRCGHHIYMEAPLSSHTLTLIKDVSITQPHLPAFLCTFSQHYQFSNLFISSGFLVLGLPPF